MTIQLTWTLGHNLVHQDKNAKLVCVASGPLDSHDHRADIKEHKCIVLLFYKQMLYVAKQLDKTRSELQKK